MKYKLTFIFCACFCLSFFSSSALAQSLLVKQDINKAVNIKNGRVVSRDITFQNGDLYWIRTIQFNKNSHQRYVMNFRIPGTKAYIRYLEKKNGKTVWRYTKCPENLPLTTCFLQTENFNMILSMANVYKKEPFNSIDIQPKSIVPVKLKKIKDGFLLSIIFPQKKGLVGEFWALQSKNTLIDWSKPVSSIIWSGYDLNEQRKWTNEGFFLKTPSSYNPSGPNMFWRCPSNFVAGCFVENKDCRAAEDLGWVMLKTILPFQNKDGFWNTGPRVEWLWKDHQVGYNFYDTRFNTNLAMYLLKGYRRYQDPDFLVAATKYGNWLKKYANDRHYSVPESVYNNVYNEISEGWLVEDYWCNQPHKPTQVSLNHQLFEISFLYEMFLTSQDVSYKETAEKMVKGIKNTTGLWIKQDGNLHYAYMSPGNMRKEDYPYLTYNDLFYTQKLLHTIYGQPDSDLQILMDSKRAWMDKNKIKGYYS